MDHASEWMKFFDKRTGRYRYVHKGSGVVRDMLMSIGKSFGQAVTRVLKKAVDKRLWHRQRVRAPAPPALKRL